MDSSVLLIEDDEITAKCLKKVLAEQNIGVDHFTNVENLREAYKNLEKYEMVFVDLMLTKGGWNYSGKDLLREMIRITDIPFYIIWTGYGWCADAEECLSIGASLVVKKNGDMDKLKNLVRHISNSYKRSCLEARCE